MNSREVTNYLKAFAILAVCTNHFINGYIATSLSGYANGFISIFFVLSGYGIYHSLEKHSEKQLPEFLIFFLKKRLMRIYPIFWIWCILHGFPNGILGFFALDFIYPKSPWFIPAIMQCYLVSVPLFLFFERIKLKYNFITIFTVFVFLNALLLYSNFSPIRAIGYRGLFFLHIFQFYLGYALAKTKNNSIYPKYYAIISLFLFFFFIQETTPQEFFEFSGKDFLFPILFSFSAVLLCHTFISINFTLPFKKTFNFIGIHTYSIYLFHSYSFIVLYKMGIIFKNNTQLSGVAIWILTLPLFILIFAAMETTINEFAFGKRSIKNAINSYLNYLPINTKNF